MDNYERVLEIVGEICGGVIADNAENVDHEGPTVADGRVIYASGTQANLEACRKAGLMGMAMPPQIWWPELPNNTLYNGCGYCEPCRYRF